MKYELDLLHYFDIYKKEWKRMLFLVAVAVSIAAVIVHLQPVTYRSTVIVLSSEESAQSVVLGGIMGLPSISVKSSSNPTIFSMLKSRRMRNGINEHFNLESKPNFWWNIDTYFVTGGFAIEVEAPDPEMTKDIANFAVKNVDKINQELQISSSKSLIKVLDPAIKGVPVKRKMSKKVISSGLFVFLIYTLFIFFKEYFSQLKTQRKR